MAGHLECIGLVIGDQAAFQRLVADLVDRAEREEGPEGTRLLWTDGSGARMAMFVDGRGSIQCAKPSFAAESAVDVREPTEIVDPGGCRFCAVTTVEVVADGEMAYPLALELDDVHRGALVAPEDGVLKFWITAFAEQIETWPGEAEYEAAPVGEGPRLGSRSLIPSGLFGLGDDPVPPRAAAIITGVVTRAVRRTNAYSGVPFDWCQLETYAATVDVVAPMQPQPFAPGQVVQGTFWVVGRRAPAASAVL